MQVALQLCGLRLAGEIPGMAGLRLRGTPERREAETERADAEPGQAQASLSCSHDFRALRSRSAAL